MAQTLLGIPIWEPTAPAFISMPAFVFGTEADMDSFVAKRAEAMAGRWQEGGDSSPDYVIAAWHRWKDGERDIVVNVAYSDLPFATEHEIRHMTERHDYDVSCTYQNTWGFDYRFHADEMLSSLVWCEWNGIPVRLAKTSARHASIDGRKVASLWGEPGVLAFDDGDETGWIVGSMYLMERRFDDVTAMEDDIQAPASIDLDSFLGQIVADG